MNALITVQLLAKTELSEKDFQTQCGQVVSVLDALSETLCRKQGMSKYYHPGELIDANQNQRAFRWQLVISLGKERLEALHRLLQILQPLLSSQVPSGTLQWKMEPLNFL